VSSGLFFRLKTTEKIANDDNQTYLWTAERSGPCYHLTRMLSWLRGRMSSIKEEKRTI